MLIFFFFQAEDGIRDLVRSRGLGDVYKRQGKISIGANVVIGNNVVIGDGTIITANVVIGDGTSVSYTHLTLPTIYSV